MYAWAHDKKIKFLGMLYFLAQIMNVSKFTTIMSIKSEEYDGQLFLRPCRVPTK